MSNFEDREKAQEAKYAQDQEINFRAQARRNKLLGIWAAEQMGLNGDDAEVYSRDVVAADFEESGEEDVFRKVWNDLQAGEADVSEGDLRTQMRDLSKIAYQQIQNGD